MSERAKMPEAPACPKCGEDMHLRLSRAVFICSECGHELSMPEIICPECGDGMYWSEHCGALVCNGCDYHNGLARCYCGWSESGGDGRAELVEMGENLDEDY